MKQFDFQAGTLEETSRLAAGLAQWLPEGSVVALNGPLGAGKTALVRAMAAACGIDAREVTSPTFVLLQTYRGRRMLYHVDAYRLRDEDEFWDLGGEDVLAGEGIAVIEWADRIAGVLPADVITIAIASDRDGTRHFSITTTVEAGFLNDLARELGQD